MSLVAVRRLCLGALVPLALVFTACDKEDNIVVENLLQEPANQPPVIVDQGPDLPPGGLEFDGIGHDLYVLVGDPNGLDDISLVTVDVDSVRLVRLLLRPDTSTTTCSRFSFAPNETLSTELILPTPHSFPGFEFMPLTKTQGGLYTAEGFGGYGYGFPDLLAGTTNVRQWNGGCFSGGGDAVDIWVVDPPAVPSPTVAIVTLVKLQYFGISVTVYDKVGASATTTFPDWTLSHSSRDELTALP